MTCSLLITQYQHMFNRPNALIGPYETYYVIPTPISLHSPQ